MSLTIKNLEMYAQHCLEKNQPMQLLIEMPGFSAPELITNPPENIKNKLAYYKATYDENCQHKHAAGIAIIDVIYDEEIHDFGWAVEQLKNGKKVAREGWNGKGMFIYLVNGTTIPKSNLRNEAALQIADSPLENVQINAHIDMKAADGSIVVGWLASQTDMLAIDWTVVS